MAGLGAKDILRNITALEQLIEEINFQRAKEMRQCLMSKDTGSDSSFLIVQGTTYWTDLFVRHFLFQTDRSTDADDLLFFIRKKHMKGFRYVPKYHTEVEVYRKDSRKLPIGDPDVDWEETVYLNLIIHQFDYTLTLAICTRTSPKELQVLKRHSQKVYASPSQRRMDTKGEVEEIIYPNVCFHVDNFDEVFADMLVRDGEMVCVELVASDHCGTRQAVIFLGSIRYDALKRVYDARASLSSKVAQRMMLALFSGSGNQRIEFVRMKGPQGKGHAEMAVLKPKGSGVETPTSEPGVSLTDLWDSDWDDEPEDRFFYKHQRRLSDPSANFNTFINSGWKSRSDGRSRSENEGLDYFADGLYEIESGDVRDAACSSNCCAMLACRATEEDDTRAQTPTQACHKCGHLHASPRSRGPVGINDLETSEVNSDSEDDFVMVESSALLCTVCGRNECLIHATDEGGASGGSRTVRSREESPVISVPPCIDSTPTITERSCSPTEEDIFLPNTHFTPEEGDVKFQTKKERKIFTKRRRRSPKKPGTAVRVVKFSMGAGDDLSGNLTLPLRREPKKRTVRSKSFDTSYTQIPLAPSGGVPGGVESLPCNEQSANILKKEFYLGYNFCVMKKIITEEVHLESPEEGAPQPPSLDRKIKFTLPFRATADGTTISYLCDMKLDDGAYNPLWTTKGFTQTFHFWKESKRAQSAPLNAYLTYVTLPWFTIITDILDHRTVPILTF